MKLNLTYKYIYSLTYLSHKYVPVQYKEIANSNEVALKQMESAYQDYKTEVLNICLFFSFYWSLTYFIGRVFKILLLLVVRNGQKKPGRWDR